MSWLYFFTGCIWNNVDKARKLLGYHPQTSIHDGLAKLWAWYQKQYPG